MIHHHKTTPAFADAAAHIAAAGHAKGLSVLLAEMQALGALLPGVADKSDSDDAVAARLETTPL